MGRRGGHILRLDLLSIGGDGATGLRDCLFDVPTASLCWGNGQVGLLGLWLGQTRRLLGPQATLETYVWSPGIRERPALLQGWGEDVVAELGGFKHRLSPGTRASKGQ